MAKRSTKAKKPTNKGGKNARPRPSRGPRGLDGPAAAYAHLLADPCGAPLVHPIYAGSDSGYLIRTDKVSPVAVGGAITAGAVLWTPGLLDGNSDDFLAIASTDWTTASAVNSYPYTPGKGFLQSNASGARCVAACLRVTFPGSEANRSGWIQYGHTNGRAIISAGSNSPAEIGVLCNHYSRTPADTIEILWRPAFADQAMVDPNVGKSQSSNHSSILLAWGGFPPGVGVVVHLTAIWEWMPTYDAGGLSAPGDTKARSNNSLDQVLDSLRDSGFAWVRDNAATVVSTGISAMSNVFGLMPSVARQRARAIRY
jgi:hypothetical protein